MRMINMINISMILIGSISIYTVYILLTCTHLVVFFYVSIYSSMIWLGDCPGTHGVPGAVATVATVAMGDGNFTTHLFLVEIFNGWWECGLLHHHFFQGLSSVAQFLQFHVCSILYIDLLCHHLNFFSFAFLSVFLLVSQPRDIHDIRQGPRGSKLSPSEISHPAISPG